MFAIEEIAVEIGEDGNRNLSRFGSFQIPKVMSLPRI
jgi:hypothetical protein